MFNLRSDKGQRICAFVMRSGTEDLLLSEQT
jgi:hypothetical protein